MPVERIFRIMMALLVGTLLQMSPAVVSASMAGTMEHMREDAHAVLPAHVAVGKLATGMHSISTTCSEHESGKNDRHILHVEERSFSGGEQVTLLQSKIANTDNIEGSCCQAHYNMHGMLGVLVAGYDRLLPGAKEIFFSHDELFLASSYKAAPWRPPARHVV